MPRRLVHGVRQALDESRLPEEAKDILREDRGGLFTADPGIDAGVRAALDWLGKSQDHSASADGGSARHYSLRAGWSASYPETSGYIVPTLIGCGERFHDPALTERARRMLDWLVSIQFPEGGFQGGVVGADLNIPVTFNTGQILLGLAAGVRAFGDRYLQPMRRAADWLASTQDPDGCWRRYRSPFAKATDKAYDTHVSWGLYEAARVEHQSEWVEAANRQVRWAISKQAPNGWFGENCLTDPLHPLTHTIGYALRGVLEAYRFTGERDFLEAALRCARGAQSALAVDGHLPGRLGSDWRGSVNWVCLTGSVQIAHCWLLLSTAAQDPTLAESAFRANAFVRRTIRLTGPPGVVGGIKGSHPVNGGYVTWELPNWAAKFFVDANLLEQDFRIGSSPP